MSYIHTTTPAALECLADSYWGQCYHDSLLFLLFNLLMSHKVPLWVSIKTDISMHSQVQHILAILVMKLNYYECNINH